MKKDLQKEISELTDNWKRALADYQNLQKRSEKEKSEFALYANSILILKLLTVFDYFEKIQGYLKDEGLNLAITEFGKVLKEEGVSEIEALGKEFNPEEMEAVETIEGEKDGTVAEVLAKGFTLKGKIIRPAKVKVTKHY